MPRAYAPSLKRMVGSDAIVAAPLKEIHLRIIACAGSGKTETLARRVAYLLAHGVPPRSIVAFAFNEDAAAELKERIVARAREKCPSDIMGAIGQLFVGTIHAFALLLLHTYRPQFAAYDMMDEDALRAWMARHAGQITGDKKWQGLWDRVQRFSSTAAIIED